MIWALQTLYQDQDPNLIWTNYNVFSVGRAKWLQLHSGIWMTEINSFWHLAREWPEKITDIYTFLQCFSLLTQTNLTNEQSECSQVTFIDAFWFAYIFGVKRHETMAASSPTHPMIRTTAEYRVKNELKYISTTKMMVFQQNLALWLLG